MNDNDIKNVFESMNENELEELLSGFRAESADELARKRMVRSAYKLAGSPARERAARPRISRRAMIAIAACLALVIALGAGSFAYAAEAKEYKAALAYFEENGMSTEGLSRSEIKEVYREFVTQQTAYTDGPSGEPTENTGFVGGISFPAENGAPEGGGTPASTDQGVWISCRQLENGWEILKYDELDQVWSYTTNEIVPRSHWYIEGRGGVVYGVLPESDPERYAAMKLSDDGEFEWLCELDEGRVEKVIGTDDGSVVVFAVANDDVNAKENELIVSQVNAAGELVYAVHNRMDYTVFLTEVYRIGDEYVVSALNAIGGEPRILRIDDDGRLTGEFKYSADGCDYVCMDIKEFGGKLYFSAYVHNDGFESILDNPDGLSDEELLDYEKKSFTAALLVCDTMGGEPEVFYEAEGAFGYTLEIDSDGELEWKVLSLFEAYTVEHPEWDSIDVLTKSKVCIYRFATDGSFIEKYDTGEIWG